LVTSKETGLEVNADKTKYMFMSQHKNRQYILRKGGTVQILGNDPNKTKLHSLSN